VGAAEGVKVTEHHDASRPAAAKVHGLPAKLPPLKLTVPMGALLP
jgi:hypothetical protein